MQAHHNLQVVLFRVVGMSLKLEGRVNKVVCADTVRFMRALPDCSIHSCVTDPPYGIEFMGTEWDNLTDVKRTRRSFGYSIPSGPGTGRGTGPTDHTPAFDLSLDSLRSMQRWHERWARELLRVLRPGAYALVFSGARTYHRLACALEDAGFIVENQIHWLYGSGFPKGLNAGKGIDKSFGIKGVPVRPEDLPPTLQRNRKPVVDTRGGHFHARLDDEERPQMIVSYSTPASELGQEWAGWNTQLKPAHEPICLVQKPLSEDTVVANLLRWGTGAMNTDACRIQVNPAVDDMDRPAKRKVRDSPTWKYGSGFRNEKNYRTGVLPSGRYPANLVLTHHPDCQLVQAGATEVELKPRPTTQNMGKHGIYGKNTRFPIEAFYKTTTPEVWNCIEGCPVRTINEQSGNQAGCKRHKVTSSKKRYEGWGNITDKQDYVMGYPDSGGAARFFYCAKPSVKERTLGVEGFKRHLTVKPLDLMRWLVRLVTPKDGIVIDPFMGSGTTAIAAELEGVDWIGCDKSAEYVRLARARIAAWRLQGLQATLDK